VHTLDADLQPHKFGLNSAWKYAQDRKNIGSTSWKLLHSSLGHTHDDDDNDSINDMEYMINDGVYLIKQTLEVCMYVRTGR